LHLLLHPDLTAAPNLEKQGGQGLADRTGEGVRRLIWAVFWVSLVLLAASFGGAVHPGGDSLAVFRHWWAVALGISSLLLLRGHWRIAALGGFATVLGAAPMAIGYLDANRDGAGAYALYQKNLRYDGGDRAGIIDDILTIAPDFVTLEEVSRPNRVIFDTLAKQCTSSLYCDFTGVGGVAVLSKWPAVAGARTCVGQRGAAVMQVRTPAGPVWVVAVHLHWPYPHGQPRQVARLVGELAALEGPIVLGGDFNMVPWSATLRKFERATGSQRAGRVYRTFVHKGSPLRLPIDHVLVPGGRGVLALRPLLGSDHFGLLARFDL
jgi:endonuclease/exonuclease/phosphatase (EEP) superfamily protein YafD